VIAFWLLPNYSQQDATFLDLFIFTDAVHVLGGSSTQHFGYFQITANKMQRFLIYLFLQTLYMF